MKLLFDANTLIEAKNRYYGFDICPGFWDWMTDTFGKKIGTIDKVWEEITGYKDELSDWAKDHNGGEYILPVSDKATQDVFRRIANHVQKNQYKDAAVAEFLSGADPWLVAKARFLTQQLSRMRFQPPMQKRRFPFRMYVMYSKLSTKTHSIRCVA